MLELIWYTQKRPTVLCLVKNNTGDNPEDFDYGGNDFLHPSRETGVFWFTDQMSH